MNNVSPTSFPFRSSPTTQHQNRDSVGIYARQSNNRDLMENEQHNQLWLVRHVSWNLFLEVHRDNQSIIIKAGAPLKHVEPASVVYERTLALFSQNKVPLPTMICYNQREFWQEVVEESKVKLLLIQIKLTGPMPDLHKPGFGSTLFSRDHSVMAARILLLAIWKLSKKLLAPVWVENVHRFDERAEDIIIYMPVMHWDDHEMEVMIGWFEANTDLDIAVPHRHVCRHVDGDPERPEI